MEILKDLIAEDCEGEELVDEFQKRKLKICPTVGKLRAVSRSTADNMDENGEEETEDFFGDLKE